MRLAVRAICQMMSALESALDELVMKMGGYSNVNPLVARARKSQMEARRQMSELLDQMIDKGVGD